MPYLTFNNLKQKHMSKTPMFMLFLLFELNIEIEFEINEILHIYASYKNRFICQYSLVCAYFTIPQKRLFSKDK